MLELGRANPFERLAHPVGLELEHSDRVAPSHHLVGLGIVKRERLHVWPLARRPLDDVERVLDHVEVPEAEEVHLQQTGRLDGLHRELGDRPVDALAAVIRPVGVGELQRHDVGQGAIGDHDRGSVDRGVADDPLEARATPTICAASASRAISASERLPGRRQSLNLGADPARAPGSASRACRRGHTDGRALGRRPASRPAGTSCRR